MPPLIGQPRLCALLTLCNKLGLMWHRDSLPAASGEPVMGVEIPRGTETRGDLAESDLLSFSLLQIVQIPSMAHLSPHPSPSIFSPLQRLSEDMR